MILFDKLFKSKTTVSMVKNAGLKPIYFMVYFMYTPILLNYLGNEKFGVWATILSIINWISFFDIGIGSGLRNILTKGLSENDFISVKKSVSTAYIILSLTSLVITFFLVIISLNINWRQFFNINFDVKETIVISIVSMTINFILGLGKSILYSLQLSEKIPLLNIISSLIQLVGVFLLNLFAEKGNIIAVAILFGLSSCIIYLFNDIYLAKKMTCFLPSFKYFDRKTVHLLYKNGLTFFILQLAGVVMTSTDNILVSNFYGASDVTPYTIATKFFFTIESVYIAFISPLWTRTNIAYFNKDMKWIDNANRKLFFIMVFFSVLYFSVSMFYDYIIRIWLQTTLIYSFSLIFVTVLCTIFEMVSLTYSNFLNGMNVLKIQAIIAIIQIILNVPFSYFFAITCNFGASGVKCGTMLLYLFSSVVYFLVFRFYIHRER